MESNANQDHIDTGIFRSNDATHPMCARASDPLHAKCKDRCPKFNLPLSFYIAIAAAAAAAVAAAATCVVNIHDFMMTRRLL